MKNVKILALIAFLSLSFTGCGPTVKGPTSSFSSVTMITGTIIDATKTIDTIADNAVDQYVRIQHRLENQANLKPMSPETKEFLKKFSQDIVVDESK